jgi:hypothetical protein
MGRGLYGIYCEGSPARNVRSHGDCKDRLPDGRFYCGCPCHKWYFFAVRIQWWLERRGWWRDPPVVRFDRLFKRRVRKAVAKHQKNYGCAGPFATVRNIHGRFDTEFWRYWPSRTLQQCQLCGMLVYVNFD